MEKEKIICSLLEETNGIALSLLIEEEKIRNIGMLDEEIEKNMEATRHKLMGAYSCCQYIMKEFKKIDKENKEEKE